MPGKATLLNVLGIVVQYAFLALMYYFLYRVTKMIYTDLKSSAAIKVDEPIISHIPRTAKLTIIKATSAHNNGLTFELGENTSIGRSGHNDIVVNEPFVSHEHACITYHKNQYWLSDLNSTNGTYLNEKKVSAEVPLKGGDVIQIGAVTFKFER